MPANVAASAAGGQIANVSLQQVRPSDTFRQARLEGLSISYPDNWKTGGDANSFLICPPAGLSDAGIAYAVIVTGLANAAGSLDQATQQVIQNIHHDNPATEPTAQVNRLRVGDYDRRS